MPNATLPNRAVDRLRWIFKVRCDFTVRPAKSLLLSGDIARAQSLRQGISAFNRQDYVRAEAAMWYRRAVA
jgi:hypothetical protein